MWDTIGEDWRPWFFWQQSLLLCCAILFYAGKRIPVNFATAAVSVLSLQTAMLTEFGGDYRFVKFMNSATGCIVCLLILGTAFYMIVNASQRLRMLD